MATIEVGNATFQALNVRPLKGALGIFEVSLVFKVDLEDEEIAAEFDRHVPGALRAFSAGYEEEASNVVHSEPIDPGVDLTVASCEQTASDKVVCGKVLLDRKAEFKKITLSCKGRGKSFVKLSFCVYVETLDEVMSLGLLCGDKVSISTSVQQVSMEFAKPATVPTEEPVHTGPLD